MATPDRYRRRIPPAALAVLALLGLATALAPLRAREPAESERIVSLLRLEAGRVAADVGAGDGEWTAALSRAVGPEGRVWSTEVDDDELDDLRERIDREDLDNVRVVIGDQERTGLAPDCCEAILLRLVYHHFQDPEAMKGDLWQALRPRGLVLVIDIVPQRRWPDLEGVPDRGGHGITLEGLVKEMVAGGFQEVSRHPQWPGDEDKFAVLFRKPPS